MAKDSEFRGVGLFDDEAGASFRSEPQLSREVMRTVAQALRTRDDADPADFKVQVHAHKGVVQLRGHLPDLGTRRLVIMAVQSLSGVQSVDAEALTVPGLD